MLPPAKTVRANPDAARVVPRWIAHTPRAVRGILQTSRIANVVAEIAPCIARNTHSAVSKMKHGPEKNTAILRSWARSAASTSLSGDGAISPRPSALGGGGGAARPNLKLEDIRPAVVAAHV